MYAIRDVVLSPSYPGHPDIPISPFSFIITKIPNETPAPSLSDPPKLPHRSRFGSYDHSDPAISAKPPRHDRFDRFERFERFTAVKPNPRNHAEPAGESEEIVDDWEMPKEDAADFDLSPLLSSSGSLNYGGWRDGQTDALLSTFASAQGAERTAAAQALWSYLVQQVPIAPICFKNGSVLTQWGRLSGLDPVRGNVFHHLEGWIIE